jgi:hypothetical protein
VLRASEAIEVYSVRASSVVMGANHYFADVQSARENAKACIAARAFD